MAKDAMALCGVSDKKIVRAMVKAIRAVGNRADGEEVSPTGFNELGDFYDALLPVLHGDVAEDDVMEVMEVLGVPPFAIAESLLPALFRKMLTTIQMEDGMAAKLHRRVERAVKGKAGYAKDADAVSSARRMLSACMAGDCTQGDLENLLVQVARMSKPEADSIAATHVLKRALADVLAEEGSTPILDRVIARCKPALRWDGKGKPCGGEFKDDVKRICYEVTDERTRQVLRLSVPCDVW
jgi:hypothetical protein